MLAVRFDAYISRWALKGELILDTEVAIRQLDPKLQNTYRYLAAKESKHILTFNRHKILHKRQQYNINQIKKVLRKQ
jgi:hypothetical protein